MINAAELAQALKGRRAGRGWKARCPAHEDRTPSLSISAGNGGMVLFKCHAGCPQGQVIDALRERGLWNTDVHSRPRLHVVQTQRDDDMSRVNYARSIWNTGVDPRDTVAEAYLASRKLFLPPELSGTVLRFHPACPWEGGTAPCMIAAFRSIKDNSVTGIHRIRLDQPERWPKGERMMLGIITGSAVKLDPVLGTSLVIGEGIETCMAARQLGFSPVWAVGSAGAIEKFGPVVDVHSLTILGENDNGANRRAAAECCRKWTPHEVGLFDPPAEFKDVNDILMQRKQKQC
jgi:putative DNA primase/helicase